MSFTDVNAHTKKIIANKHEKSMAKLAVTTSDRNIVNLEKTFSLEDAGSVLRPEINNQVNNKNSFTQKIDTLRKNHRLGLKNNTKIFEENASIEKQEIFNIPESEKTPQIVNVPTINNEAMQMINALIHTQNHIVQELTEVFDKRLEKFDDIILDLIRCKTENERLKQKVDNLTRDNYKSKKEIESFRSVIPGVYIKKELDKTRF
ncbi:MAG: hypothetical protein WCG23_01240 [bacterium]